MEARAHLRHLTLRLTHLSWEGLIPASLQGIPQTQKTQSESIGVKVRPEDLHGTGPHSLHHHAVSTLCLGRGKRHTVNQHRTQMTALQEVVQLHFPSDSTTTCQLEWDLALASLGFGKYHCPYPIRSQDLTCMDTRLAAPSKTKQPLLDLTLVSE